MLKNYLGIKIPLTLWAGVGRLKTEVHRSLFYLGNTVAVESYSSQVHAKMKRYLWNRVTPRNIHAFYYKAHTRLRTLPLTVITSHN